MTRSFSIYLCMLVSSVVIAHAEKVMQYDEKQGIIFVDEQTGSKKGLVDPPKTTTTFHTETLSVMTQKTITKNAIQLVPTTARNATDIHVGRDKDPAKVYLQSGLEYFKNGDYANALKNFTYADSVEPKPEYLLWVGKCYRQLGKPDQMLVTMKTILNSFPQSDVADDALFEIAFYYKEIDDYDASTKLFSQLTEQYPFGESFSNRESFLEVAKDQRRIMTADVRSMLATIGYSGNDLEELYRTFQKDHALAITGIGSQSTVRALKAAYAAFLKNAAAAEARLERLKIINRYAFFGIGIVVLNTIILISLNAAIRGKRRYLENLEQLLAELDVKTL